MFIAFLTYFYVIRATTIVNVITIPPSLTARGLDPVTLTTTAVFKVPAAIRRQLDRIRSRPVGSFISTPTGTQCVSDYQLDLPTWDAFLLATTINAYPASSLLDSPTGKLPSLRRLIHFLVRLLDLPHVEINPSIIETDNGLSLNIVAIGPARESYRSHVPVGSLDKIADTFTDALVVYLAPSVSASAVQPRLPQQLDDQLFIAETILRDPMQTLLIKFQQLNLLARYLPTAAVEKTTPAYQGLDLANSIEQEHTLDSLPQSVHNLFRMAILFAKMTFASEIRRSRPSKDELKWLFGSDDFAVVADQIWNINDHDLKSMLSEILQEAKSIAEMADGNRVIMAYYAFILSIADPSEELTKTLLDLIINPTEAEIRGEDVRNAAIVNILALDALVDLGQFRKVTEKLTRIRDDLDYKWTYPSDLRAALDAVYARIKLATRDTETMIQLLSSGELDSLPCLELNLVGKATHKNAVDHDVLEELPPEAQRKLLEEFDATLQRVEGMGFGNFDFFNSWGSMLQKLGQDQKAEEKYARSLEFPGEHVWAYLNWASAVVAQGDFPRAIKLYDKSLELGNVPYAVYGLLGALSSAGDSERFLQEYRRYRSILGRLDNKEKRTFSMVALYHACRLGQKSDPETLVQFSAEELAQFDRTTCQWSEWSE